MNTNCHLIHKAESGRDEAEEARRDLIIINLESEREVIESFHQG